MSQDWDVYFLRVEDKPASILVDLGIANEAPIKALPYMSYIRVRMSAPRSDGLASEEEFEALKSLEDAMVGDLTRDGETIYVGRNTSDGCRDFYFYTAQPNGWDGRVNRLMLLFAPYKFDCGSRNDPEWKTYFEFLYPSDIDWVQIKSRRVCSILQRHGDLLTEEREIDHWAYFPNADARVSFIEAVLKLGFRLRSLIEPEEAKGSYGVHIYRTDIPALGAIDEVTLPLFKLAVELGGDYDGWGSPLVTPKPH